MNAKNTGLCLMVCLAAWCAGVAGYIEVLDLCAGGNLKSRQLGAMKYWPPDDDAVFEVEAKTYRREHSLPRDATLDQSALSVVNGRVASIRKKRIRHNALLRAVDTVGLFQVFSCPLLLVLSLAISIRSKGIRPRVIAAACAAVSVVCIFLLIFRGYWAFD